MYFYIFVINIFIKFTHSKRGYTLYITIKLWKKPNEINRRVQLDIGLQGVKAFCKYKNQNCRDMFRIYRLLLSRED